MPRPFVDIEIGSKFGRLTVVSLTWNEASGRKIYACKCECGKRCYAYPPRLLSGKEISCGCRRPGNITHGLCMENGILRPEHNIWSGIKARCYNANHPAYKDYGARGIHMCQEWRDSFDVFYMDIGERPSPQHTIERRDNNGPYCKDNCEWSTRKVQARNRRSTRYVSYQGRHMSLAEACEIAGVNYDAAKHRINAGYQFDEMIRVPFSQRRGQP